MVNDFIILILITIFISFMAYMDHKYSGGEIVERRRKKKRDDKRKSKLKRKNGPT